MDRQCEARSRSQVPSTDLLRVTRTLVCLPLPSLPAPLIAQAAAATLPDRQFHDPHLHLNRDPGRFLFGSDTVAPAFTPAASLTVRESNDERLFGAARVKVRT